MAYDMISDLTAVTTPATTDLVEIEQGGVSYKATVAQITGAPNGGQPPAPKPSASGVGIWTTIASSITPNVAGALWAVICFNASGNFVGSSAPLESNFDLTSFYATCTQMHVYRTA